MSKIILRAGKVAIKIILLFAILGFIFYSVKLLTPAKASEDPPTEQEAVLLIEQADAIYQDIKTGTYSKKGRYDQAAQAAKIYQTIVTDYPDTENAFEAQAKLVNLDIVRGRWPQAQAAYQKLLTDFAGNENMPRAVRDIAYRYHIFKKYNEAVELYQYITDTWPDSEFAMWSYMGMAMSNIALGDDAAVGANIDRLLGDFAGDERLPEAFRDIAYQYHTLEKYDKAVELYQYITDTWPDSFHAMWSHMGAAMSNIALGDDEAAGADIDNLLGFAGTEYDSHIAQAVRDVAYQCHKFGRYEKAKQLYQYILDNYPDSEYVIWAKAGIIQSDIGLGNDPNITEELDKLIADFADSPGLPDRLHEIAGEYCTKGTQLQSGGVADDGYFHKAITVWEKIIQQYPDSPACLSRAYYCLGACYSHFLAEYAKAIENYQRVVDNWPYFDYQRASYAQFGIAGCYQNLEKSGEISAEEATNRIQQACNNLLSDYPDTNPVILQAAHKLLDKYQVSE